MKMTRKTESQKKRKTENMAVKNENFKRKMEYFEKNNEKLEILLFCLL